MTDRENFLERWSRRKIEIERDAPQTPEPSAAPPVANDAAPSGEAASPERAAAQPTVPKPEFDIASLPSLESITAATDVRAFLAPGVPPELARAALRRAWAADPAIRNFKGLADYDWDFTDPNAMPGFGDLPTGTDIQSMVAQIFGQAEKLAGVDQPEERQAAQVPEEIASPTLPDPEAPPAASKVEAAAAAPLPVETTAAESTQGILVQRDNIIASHNSSSGGLPEQPKTRRSHGRALPQ